jgi:hypothetical protein
MDWLPKLCAGDLLLGAGDSPKELDPKSLLLVDVTDLEVDLPSQLPPPFEEEEITLDQLHLDTVGNHAFCISRLLTRISFILGGTCNARRSEALIYT